MKKIILPQFYLVLALFSNISFAQMVTICQTDSDATVGIDRKDWNGGNTVTHSEGYMLNFTLPDNTFGDCKKILQVDIDFDIIAIDESGVPMDCSGIGAYWTNMYVGCSDFSPASCPISNLLDEFPSFPIGDQLVSKTCPPDEFPFGEILGVDIIPAVNNVSCADGQSMVSSGNMSIDFEICVTVTIGDDFIDMPVDLGGDVFVCAGQTTQLDAGPNYANYEWDPNGQSSQTINEGEGVYSVTVTDNNGCTDTDEIEVFLSDPSVTISSDDSDLTICQGETTVLTANTSANTINWDNGDSGPTTTVGPGMYTVEVTDANGCMDMADIEIMSFPTPIVNANPAFSEVCENDQSLITATSGFVVYDWGNGITGNPVNLDVGMYTLTITDGNGCEATTMVEIQGVSAPEAGDDVNLDVCNDGSTYNLENELGPNDNGGTWIDLDGSGIDLNINDASVDFSGLLPGDYDFSYTVAGTPPCSDDVAIISVTVGQEANAGTSNSISFCTNEMGVDIAALLGTFDSNGSWTDENASGIDLNANATNVDFSGVAAGFYEFTYEVLGMNPCDDDQAVISVTIEDGVDAGLDNSFSLCEGGTYDLLDALSAGASSGGTFIDNDGSGALNGTVFSSAGLAGQTFTFTYGFGAGGDCGTDQSLITISVVSTVTAGLDSPNNESCIGDVIDLFNLIPDADMGGVFLDLDGTGALTGNLFDTNIAGTGTFEIQYMIGDDVICPSDVSLITITLVAPPSISYNSGAQLCDDQCYDIIFMFSGTPDYNYGLSIFDASSNLTQDINPVVSVISDTLTVCNDGGNGQILNDTLHIDNSSLEWYVIPTSFGDNNCDIVLEPDTIFIQTGNLVTTTVDPTLCPGGFIDVNGTIYDMTNPTGTEMLNTVSGCDSTINVNLTFYEPADSLLNPTLCSGTSIEVNGTIYDESNPTGTEIFMNGSVQGCDSTVNIQLMFDNIISIDDFVDLCAGDSIFLEGAWQFNDGTYLDSYVTQSGCDSVVTTVLDVLELNTNDEFENICLGDSIFLAGAWQFNSGNYEDSFSAANGCDSIVITMLTVEACAINVDFNLTNNDCAGGDSGIIKLDIGAGDEPYTVNWIGTNSGESGSLPNQNSTNQVCIENLISDQYDISIVGNSGTTIFTDVATITDLNLPLTGTFDITNASCSGVSDGSIDAAFQGGFGGNVYDWEPDLGVNADVFNLSAGTYFLTATDEAGCSESFEIVVGTEAEISFSSSIFDVSCLGLDDGVIMISDLQNEGVNPSIEINGMPLAAPYVLENLSAGNYVIDITNDSGCSANESVTILEGPSLDLINYDTNYSITAGDSIVLAGELMAAVDSINWSPASTLSCDNCENPIAFPLMNQTYTLTVFDESGCTDQVDIFVAVSPPDNTIILPNIFTPDGNGVNDEFIVNLEVVSEAELFVYDRWGNLTFNQSATTGQTISWDGRSKGQFVSSGVYVYVLEIIDITGARQLQDGEITLIR